MSAGARRGGEPRRRFVEPVIGDAEDTGQTSEQLVGLVGAASLMFAWPLAGHCAPVTEISERLNYRRPRSAAMG